MTTFLGTAVESEVRLIVNDAAEAKFSDATMLIAVNAALRAVLKDAPASRYTALNAYVDSVTLSALSGSRSPGIWRMSTEPPPKSSTP